MIQKRKRFLCRLFLFPCSLDTFFLCSHSRFSIPLTLTLLQQLASALLGVAGRQGTAAGALNPPRHAFSSLPFSPEHTHTCSGWSRVSRRQNTASGPTLCPAQLPVLCSAELPPALPWSPPAAKPLCASHTVPLRFILMFVSVMFLPFYSKILSCFCHSFLTYMWLSSRQSCSFSAIFVVGRYSFPILLL